MAIPHAEPGQPISLAALRDGLREAATHALIKTQALELIHVVLPQGKALPPHSLRGEVTIQCIEGELVVAFSGTACQLSAGQLVLLPAHTEHAVHAARDSSALLTVQLPPGLPGSSSSTAAAA